MTKHLIVDGQVLQTDAWYRGMGKYTLQLLHELDSIAPAEIQLYIVFNIALGRHEERIKVVQYLCPKLQIITVELPIPESKTADRKTYRRALGQVIKNELNGVAFDYLITSLFTFDFFAEFPDDCRKLLLFYDLAPLLLWHDLGGYFPPDLYMKRFQIILEAEHILSISGTTRNDLLRIFGISPGTVTSINGGFTKIAEHTKKPTGFKVPARYILFPTGDLPHKNNDIAVKGFKEYIHQSGDDVSLLITSNFSDASQKLLGLSKHIIFTGNVSDEELEWLYEHAQVVLFASKYEGLGIPMLDAIESKRPVVASRIPVFEEMSREAFYFFNPDDHHGLAWAMAQAMHRVGFEQRREQYAAILQTYTWEATAKGALRVIQGGRAQPKTLRLDAEKPRIAIVCLHPGIGDQIGRLAESLFSSLHENFSVDYYLDANGHHYTDLARPTFLDFLDCRVFDISKLTLSTYVGCDAVVYLVDETALPSRMVQRACIFPGITLAAFTGEPLDNLHKILKDILLENQTAVWALADQTYVTYQHLAQEIDQFIPRFKKRTEAIRRVASKGGTKGSIMRALMAVEKP